MAHLKESHKNFAFESPTVIEEIVELPNFDFLKPVGRGMEKVTTRYNQAELEILKRYVPTDGKIPGKDKVWNGI